MSEVAANEVATAPAEAPQAQPDTGGTVRSRAHNRLSELASSYDAPAADVEAVDDTALPTQPRDERGRFAAPEGEVPEDELPPDEAAAASESEDLGDAEAEATDAAEPSEGPPDGMVRIEYPEDHPLRAQGKEYIDVPAAYERDARALINAQDPVRRGELDRARREAVAAQQRAAELDAEIRFLRDNASEYWTADDQQTYEDLKQTYGEQQAEAFRAGRMKDADSQLQSAKAEAALRSFSETWQQNGQEFSQGAYKELPEILPGVTQAEIDTALKMYGNELDNLQRRALQNANTPQEALTVLQRFAESFDYSVDDFMAVAGDYLRSRPGVLQLERSQSTAEDIKRRKIQAEVEAQKREELKQASQRHAQNPHRNLGGVDAGQRSLDVTPEPESNVGKTVGEVRAASKSRLRALGERLAGAQ